MTNDDIRHALANGELLFHYQPKVSFLTGRINGAEALIRWRRGQDRLVEPDAFIPRAERSGLLPEITRRMFPRLLEDAGLMREQAPDTAVALNVSAADLDTPSLVERVQDATARGAIPRDMLEIEVTERAVVGCSDESDRSLLALVDEGVRLSMDDYGTGFSSLETLNRVPFSAIKIDQGFVLSMLASAKSATLVKASIATAQMLGIKTVVEGIESETVYNFLLHSGCDEAQGYWLSRPLPLDEYIALLRSAPRWRASPVGMLRMAQLSHTWQHKLLMDAIFAYLRCADGHQPNLDDLHLDHHSCNLGQWCEGGGRDFAGDPDFDTLQAPHRRMHDICDDIFGALEAHAASSVLTGLLRELTEAACVVSDCLQRLETRLLVQELGDDACKSNR